MLVRYSRHAIKFLSKLDAQSIARIRAAIDGLNEQPPQGDIKPMRGYADGRKRLRVGSWRIIFTVNAEYWIEGPVDVLSIIDIGNRGDIYK